MFSVLRDKETGRHIKRFRSRERSAGSIYEIATEFPFPVMVGRCNRKLMRPVLPRQLAGLLVKHDADAVIRAAPFQQSIIKIV